MKNRLELRIFFIGVSVLFLAFRAWINYEPNDSPTSPQFLKHNNAELVGVDVDPIEVTAALYNAVVVNNPVAEENVIRIPCIDVRTRLLYQDNTRTLCVVEIDDYILSEDQTSATLTRNQYYMTARVTRTEDPFDAEWYSYEQHPRDGKASAMKIFRFYKDGAKRITSSDYRFQPNDKRGELLTNYCEANGIPLQTIHYNGEDIRIQDVDSYYFE